MIRDLGLDKPRVWVSALIGLAGIVVFGGAALVVGACVVVATGGGAQP